MAPLLLVAVLYFDNNTPDKDFELLKKGMADMLITDLAGVEGLQVVEREKLESLLAEMKMQRSKYFDPKTAQKLGKGMGATHAITGAFNSVGNQLRIDVRLIEIKTSKVVTTDKVIGKKDEFFDLEQKLTASFSCALQPKTCREEEQNQSEAEAPLPSIMRFSKALDLADGGNLEDASKEMKQVMTDAPTFSVAKSRYLAIMKRIYAARTVRKSELSENEKRLVAKVDRVLGKETALPRLVGYRVLRGQIVLHRIDALFKTMAQSNASPQAADLETFRDLMKQYRDNQLALLELIEKQNELPDPEIDEADAKAGMELGLGDEPGNLDFYDTIQIRRDLGSFLTTGKEPFWGTFRWSAELAKFSQMRIDSGVRISGKTEYRDVPRAPVKLLGNAFVDEGLKLFQVALAEVPKKKTDAESVQTETIRTLDAHAQALFELGRLEDAIAQWQTILDRYPKYEDFQEIEDKIKAALGSTP
jgi:TolB-like protein/tetratricopeptide (TPR) repeat protein